MKKPNQRMQQMSPRVTAAAAPLRAIADPER
jgi:hypothetical protein